jgi:hypothetical protein
MIITGDSIIGDTSQQAADKPSQERGLSIEPDASQEHGPCRESAEQRKERRRRLDDVLRALI